MADPDTLAGAQGESRGAHVADAIHRSHQLRIRRSVEFGRPVREVHALFAGEPPIDLLGDEWQQRAHDLAQGDEHRVQRVVGVLLVRVVGISRSPEAIPAAPDIPVVQRVEVLDEALTGPGEVIGIEGLRDAGHEVARLCEDVAVEHLLAVRAELRADAVGVGVEGKEVPGVPDGLDDDAHRVAHLLVVCSDGQVAASYHRGRHQEPAQGVRADLLKDILGIGVVAQALAELLPAVSQDHPVTDAVLEGRPIKDRRRQYVHGVEPTAGLGEILDDEVRREVIVEPLLVLERVVDLREGHRTRLEPAVEHLRDAAHHALACRVVGVRAHEVVDVRSVQVRRTPSEISLDLVEAPVDVHARVGGIVALPDRDRRAPEAIPRDRPVDRAFEPLAEATVPYVRGDPIDLLVEFDGAFADGRHPHVPGVHRLVDQWLARAPAVRVAVCIGLVADDDSALLQFPDDRLVGVEDLYSLPRRNLGGEAARVVDRHDRGNVIGVAGLHVVFAEAGRHVHDAGPLFGIYEIRAQHAEGVFGVREEREERRVFPPHELVALEGAHSSRVGQLLLVLRDCGFAEDQVATVQLEDRVIELRPDGDCQVRGQRPGGRRPGEQIRRPVVFALQLEAHGDGRILAVPVGVVLAGLEVREHRLGRPGVGHHLVAFVEQALLVQLLHGPHQALHVGQLEGLVVVLEVHPAGGAVHIALPLAHVPEHGRLAILVEAVDSVVGDGLVAVDAEFFLGEHLDG